MPAAKTGPVLDLRLARLSLGGSEILGPIDVTIRRSETVALTGPSGIGKSTLLRVVAGLETDFSGQRVLNGRVAVVFQEPALLPWRTLMDNLLVTTRISQDQAMAALADVGLADRATSYPQQLSLGQQRRLSLARAFAVRPDLLLLDEPFVSLDPQLVDSMIALFIRLREAHGVATMIVTHVRAEAEQLADRIVTLGGSPARIVPDDQNRGAYFHSSASGVTSAGS